MRHWGSSVASASYARRLLMRGSSSGDPNWHQPTHVSPSKTRAACARPSATRHSLSARFRSGVRSRSFTPSGWKPMHQHPPQTPLLRSTSAAKSGHVEASSGAVRSAVMAPPSEVSR